MDFRVGAELRAALKEVAAAAKTGSEAELEAKLEEAVRRAGQEISSHVLKEVAAQRREELKAAKIGVRGG
jgi:ribosomal protein S20